MSITIDINRPSYFLKFLWNNNLPPGYINVFIIQKFENGTERIISKFIRTDQIDIVDNTTIELNNQFNVYYGVGTRSEDLGDSRRGKYEEVSGLPGFWMDFDTSDGEHKKNNLPSRDELFDFIKLLPWPPSLKLSSGGGYHVYWLFDKPYNINNETDRKYISNFLKSFQVFINQLALQYGWNFDLTANIPFALRLPGTTNKKYDPLRNVEVIHADNACRYPHQDLIPPQIAEAKIAQPYISPVQKNNISSEIIITGGRNTRLTSIAGSLRNHGMDEHEINNNLQEINKSQCMPPLSDKEVAGIARSVSKYTPGVYKQSNINMNLSLNPNQINYELSDFGNASLFVDHYIENIRYCHDFQRWLIYDGTRWKIDKNQTIDTMARNLITNVYAQTYLNIGGGQNTRQKHLLKSQSYKSLLSMLMIARTDEKIKISSNMLDADPMLLNCANVTVDLRTGEVLPHDINHYITKSTHIIYDKDATCPRFMRFLDEIMLEDRDKIKYLQRTAGYSLTGLINEECVFILLGSGKNGKTKYRETIKSLLGDYAGQCDFNTVAKVKNDTRIRNDIAKLIGARCAMASEIDKTIELNWPLIKALTGGDTSTARFLFKEYMDFQVTYKIYFTTNHIPNIDIKDQGILRRIHVIRFNAYFPEMIQDKYLEDQLRNELPGILNWAIKGCLEWQELKSLAPPEGVLLEQNISTIYLDIMYRFFEDKLELSPSSRIKKTAVWKFYQDWCQKHNIQVIPKKQFYQLFLDNNINETQIDGYDVFTGLQEKQSSDENDFYNNLISL